MNYFLAIGLSLLFLTQGFTISLRDFIQIVDLVEHASFHQDTYGDNFKTFLAKHYGELKEEHHREHQDEKEEHEKLPFNHHSWTSNLTGFILLPNEFLSVKVIAVPRTSSIFLYKETYSSIRESGIFQPPRLA